MPITREKGVRHFSTVKGSGTFFRKWCLTPFLVLLCWAAPAQAATLYWVGADGAPTSVASNWSTANPMGCGYGNAAAAPGQADVAVFNPGCGSGATVNNAWTVHGLHLRAGYTGTITQAAAVIVGTGDFVQDGGAWRGGKYALDVNGSFALSRGTHTATTGAWTLARNLTHRGGNLVMTGATVTVDGGDASADTTIACAGTLGGRFVFAKTGSGADITIGSGCAMTVADVNGAFGTITVNGTMRHTGSRFNVDNNSSEPHLGSVVVNTGGMVTSQGKAMAIEGDLLIKGGKWEAPTAIIVFDGEEASDDAEVSCNRPIPGMHAIQKSGGGDFTLAPGCDLTVGSISGWFGTFTNEGTLRHAGSTFKITNQSPPSGLGALINGPGGTITYAGTDVYVEGNFTQRGRWDLTGKTIHLIGDSGSYDDGTLTCGTVIQGNVEVNKAGGDVLALASHCTIGGNFTRTNGKVANPASAWAFRVRGNLTVLGADGFGGPNLTVVVEGPAAVQTIKGTGTLSGILSGPFEVDKSAGVAQLATAFATGANCTVVKGVLDLNGHNLDCGGNFTLTPSGKLFKRGGTVR